MSDTYSKIRFIGYAIPTTPAKLVFIGDANGPGAVAGTYSANTDTVQDLRSRVSIMKNAVDLAKAQLPERETDVVNVFVVPEFFFHGPMGPYVYDSPSNDPVDELRTMLETAFGTADYPNWTFICGSAVTTQLRNIGVVLGANSARSRNAIVQALSQQWIASFGPLKAVIFDMLVNFIKNCHSYPNCEVRNRCIIVSNVPIRIPEEDNPTHVMMTEKYYVSNEDFLLFDVTGKRVITEQMIGYPPIDLSDGDAKQSPFDPYAIFRQNSISAENPIATTVTDYGIEICLDHSDTRLRRNIDNEPDVIGGVHVQIIPSCGMQISLPSIAADRNGLVFNCDGQYALSDSPRGQGVINGVDCLYANFANSADSVYSAHSQLARVMTPAKGGDPTAPGAEDAILRTLDPSDITVIPVEKPPHLDTYFAGGAGEIHMFGRRTPYTLYPE